MIVIPDTELILNKQKKIYHLNLSKEQIADDIILVGDPSRVESISKYFDQIEYKVQNREFYTHTGIYKNKRISVISTGIGTDNIDIVLNELDALVNINLENRTVNKKHKSLNIIRIGTSGGLQKDIPVDSFIAGSYGLGFDGLAHFYNHSDLETEQKNAFIKHCNWPKELAEPYIVKASDTLLEKFHDIDSGITATATGFYGPQGRNLRLTCSIDKFEEKLSSFYYKELKIKNFEMETSALYFLSKILGHNAISICAIMGNRITKKYSNNYTNTLNKLILTVLERLSN